MTVHNYATELVGKRLDNVKLSPEVQRDRREAAWEYVLDALDAFKDSHEGLEAWAGAKEIPDEIEVRSGPRRP